MCCVTAVALYTPVLAALLPVCENALHEDYLSQLLHSAAPKVFCWLNGLLTVSRVGNELGAGRPKVASYSTYVGLCLTLITTVCIGALMFTFRFAPSLQA